MALLKYFKPITSMIPHGETSQDPSSSLRVPLSAIPKANKTVAEVLEQSSLDS